MPPNFWRHPCGAGLRRNLWLHALGTLWRAFLCRHFCGSGLRRRATYGLMPLALLWLALLLGVTYGFRPLASLACILLAGHMSPKWVSIPTAPNNEVYYLWSFWRHPCGAGLRRNLWLHALGTLWPAFLCRHFCGSGLRRRATYGLMPLALLWPALLLGVTYGFRQLVSELASR